MSPTYFRARVVLLPCCIILTIHSCISVGSHWQNKSVTLCCDTWSPEQLTQPWLEQETLRACDTVSDWLSMVNTLVFNRRLQLKLFQNSIFTFTLWSRTAVESIWTPPRPLGFLTFNQATSNFTHFFFSHQEPWFIPWKTAKMSKHKRIKKPGSAPWSRTPTSDRFRGKLLFLWNIS